MGLWLPLSTAGFGSRLRNDWFDIVVIDSKTGSLAVAIAWKRLRDHALGCNLPRGLNNVADLFVGAAVDGLGGCHVGRVPSSYSR